MKNYFFNLLFLFSFLPSFGAINYIYSYNEAIKQAKAQNKFIFVDFTANWCTPCKLMENEMDADGEASSLYNSNFINLKVDCSRKNSMSQKFQITSFPTIIFIDKDENIIKRINGYIGIEGMKMLARFVLNTPELFMDISTLELTPTDSSIVHLERYLKLNASKVKTTIKNISTISPEWEKYMFENHYLDFDYNYLFQYVKKILHDHPDQNGHVEKLILHQLNSKNSHLDYENFNAIAEDITESGFLTKQKILVFLYNYDEHIRRGQLGMSRIENLKTYSKDLIKIYPEIHDKMILEMAFSVLIQNHIDDFYLQSIKPSIEKLANEENDYYYTDILSYINYRLGDKTQAYQLSAKAKELAIKQGEKNMTPILKKYRKIISE